MSGPEVVAQEALGIHNEILAQHDLSPEYAGVMLKYDEYEVPVEDALKMCPHLAALPGPLLTMFVEDGRQNFIDTYPERAHEADYMSVRAERIESDVQQAPRESAFTLQFTDKETDLVATSGQQEGTGVVTKSQAYAPELHVELGGIQEQAAPQYQADEHRAGEVLTELAQIHEMAQEGIENSPETPDFVDVQAAPQNHVLYEPSPLFTAAATQSIGIAGQQLRVELQVGESQHNEHTVETANGARPLGEVVWQAAQDFLHRVQDQYIDHRVEPQQDHQEPGSSHEYDTAQSDQTRSELMRAAGVADRSNEIQDILEFQPTIELRQLLTSFERDDTIWQARETDEGTDEDERPTIFESLEMHLEELKVTEPIKVERLKPVVDEITQISEALVKLHSLQMISEVVDEANGFVSEESTERHELMTQFEARLEVICVRLLEELGVEPKPEVVQQLIQEFMSAVQASNRSKQLSAEYLASHGMHNAKLATSFMNLRSDARSLAHVAAQMLTRNLFPVTAK